MAATAMASWAPIQVSPARTGAKPSCSIASSRPASPGSLLLCRNPSVLFPRPIKLRQPKQGNGFSGVVACLSPDAPRRVPAASTKLYVSGLSFRTTEEGLRNAFEKFGQLADVNLVMDRVANRPRGFAFLRYATEEESKKAIEGMHGKV
ncbi:hypothetical protein Taro_019638 [Colocasia esculenta]|uniref:RRM domain-containing protein n=1 Tax=Colocasia esculenta TaxID=4460 RepID=A0A843UWS3_COLES|nr:hypothetical protein [Colocasia esculenta]